MDFVKKPVVFLHEWTASTSSVFSEEIKSYTESMPAGDLWSYGSEHGLSPQHQGLSRRNSCA